MPIKTAVEGLRLNTETDQKQPQILESNPQTNGKPQATGGKQESSPVSSLPYCRHPASRNKGQSKEMFLIEQWAA